MAKGIPIKQLLANSVYDHYEKAPELHIKDVKIFLEIIKEKYPEISDTAEAFFKGKMFYPCNMFIMKKELSSIYHSF